MISNFRYFNIDTKFDCLNYGGDWIRDLKTNFDNIGFSLVNIFILSQSFSWADAMNKALAIRGVDMNPV